MALGSLRAPEGENRGLRKRCKQSCDLWWTCVGVGALWDLRSDNYDLTIVSIWMSAQGLICVYLGWWRRVCLPAAWVKIFPMSICIGVIRRNDFHRDVPMIKWLKWLKDFTFQTAKHLRNYLPVGATIPAFKDFLTFPFGSPGSGHTLVCFSRESLESLLGNIWPSQENGDPTF